MRWLGGHSIVVIVIVAGSFAACASTGAVYTPRPFPMPGGGGSTAIPAPVDPSAPPVASNPPAHRLSRRPRRRDDRIPSCPAPARHREWLRALGHRALAARRAVPGRRRRSIRLRLQRVRPLRLRAARRRDAAAGSRSVPRRQERRPRSAGARRPGVLFHDRAGRVARRHRDRRRSVHPRAKRTRRGPRREPRRSSTGPRASSAPSASAERACPPKLASISERTLRCRERVAQAEMPLPLVFDGGGGIGNGDGTGTGTGTRSECRSAFH